MLLTKTKPRKQAITSVTLHVDSVSCVQQKNRRGKDFIYIQITSGKPGTTLVGIMCAGETKVLSERIRLAEGPCYLELWDKETIATNERIGRIDLRQCVRDMPQEVTILNETACYRLGFKLVTQ